MKSLSEMVKELRINKGITQDELARELGYTNKNTITKIETNVNKVIYEMMKKITKFFKINVAYLFDDDNDPFPYTVFTTDINGKRKIYHLIDKQFYEIILKLNEI